ncbi:hypothetical protein GT360_11720 [Vibrio astriarenae]|uniref:DNA polymerase III subunit beta n=1 Tax=Vibrio astriarenae TaxID=1481923 RepID=A0A7Z2YE98_9VIBR|nr:hypothetical protein [Vibrio astriarenae]QIA64141.1 hypothetical protein GT360_11720 [Vibrio astriarenae]
MKKTMALVMASTALFGCQSMNSQQESSAQEAVYSQSVSLKSALWFNKMPTFGDNPEFNLHGSLVLEQKEGLPAELDIDRITLHQGGDSYLLTADQFELRGYSESQWEIAFALPIELSETQPVDVFVYFEQEGNLSWVSEQGVTVEVVY